MSTNLDIKEGAISYNLEEVLFVNDISFSNGYIYQIKGDNGSGKTSFFRAILNYKTRFSGKIYLNNENITNLSTESILSRKISFVPQDRSTFARLSIKQHINLICQNSIFKSNHKEIFSYLGRKEQLGKNLSGGQAKLLLLLLNISFNPKIILMDEPFAGLDDDAKLLLEKVLNDWHTNDKCIIFTDHSPKNLKNKISLKIEQQFNKFKLISYE